MDFNEMMMDECAMQFDSIAEKGVEKKKKK